LTVHRHYSVTLSGAQQVPAVTSSGTGTGTVALSGAQDKMFVNLAFSGLSSTATGTITIGLSGAATAAVGPINVTLNIVSTTAAASGLSVRLVGVP
jgi:CHRD domain